MNTKQSTFNADHLVKSFVPVILQNEYANNPERKMSDQLKEDHATLLWIDLCNFSPLCSRLMKDAVSGVEKITGILSDHYDSVTSLVSEYGGQPLFFAGDGLMSAWPGDKVNASDSIQLAAACAFKIIDNRHTVDDKNELLSLHAIVAVGPWEIAELEGIHGSRLVSFFGEVFSDLSSASKNKAPDQVLITNTALAFLSKELKSEPVEYDTSILHDYSAPLAFPEMKSPVLNEEAVKKLKLFIPRTLAFPLNAERLKWIAEIRPVTMVFVRLPNTGKSSAENLRQLRESVAQATPLVQKYDGLLNQVCTDEKGSNILICFGPPPASHIDNPERSVRLGFEIHHALKKSGIGNSVGVSSGMAYCGILGNDTLRQYTIIGDVVNMSAHIAGIKRNEIFCDKSTYNASNKTVNYGGQIMAMIKGHKEPIPLSIPKSLLQEGLQSSVDVSVGRENELAVLTNAFHKTAEGNSQCIIIEGESGMGKTKLLKEFAAALSSEDAILAAGQGDFISRNTPYAVLRTIFSNLLGISNQESEEMHASVYDSLVERFGNKASLLNIVLNTTFPDSEVIGSLSGSQRVQATQDFLLQILNDESRRQPLVMVIDDASWVDESTWKLIAAMKNNLSRCLIVLSFQTTESLMHVPHLKDLGAETIVLKELADEDLEALICAKLDVSSISRDVRDVVLRISKGNPFFCIELTGWLLDNELLVYNNNSCSLVEYAGMKEFSLPETVRSAIRSRIDRLGPGSQLSLKVGSVVGSRFSEKIISNIYPIATERDFVRPYLHEVGQYGMLNETMVDSLPGYAFNCAVTVEVTYEMTLAEQRRQLHREIAEWYEKNFSSNLQPFYVRLANHWKEANEKDKAVAYYENEAIRLFRLGFVKEGLDVGLEGVKLLGQNIPRDLPSIGKKIEESMAAIGTLMHRRTVEGLIDHKQLENPKTQKVINLLLSLAPFAHQSQQGELFALMTIMSQQLTLEQGNGESAAEVYAMYSIIYKALTGDTETSFTWSNLSLEIDKKNGHTFQSRVLFIHCWFIALWKVPIKKLIPLSYAGADAGFKSGDILFACFNLSLTVVLKATCGINLNEVIDAATDNYNKNNNAVINAAFHLKHEEQVAKAFQGRTADYTSLTDEKYDEALDIASICKTDLFNQIAYYFVSKLKLNVHFGNWDEAISWGEKSFPLLPAFANQPGHIEFEQFYTMAALYKSAETGDETAVRFSTISAAGIEKIQAWAQLCPGNFLHKAYLVQAIHEGFSGDSARAEKLFVEAAETALAAGYIQDSGLAFEHLVRMKKRKGVDYSSDLQSATEAYQKWGADGKVRYLSEEFGLALNPVKETI